MRSSGINAEEELRGQLVNPGSSGKMAIKMECMKILSQLMWATTHRISMQL